MEPPKPDLHIFYSAAPNASQQETMEYERLLAERFQSDPDMPKDPAALAQDAERERRIQELHQKIFGVAR